MNQYQKQKQQQQQQRNKIYEPRENQKKNFITIMFIFFAPDGISRLINFACYYYRYLLLSETPELFLKWKKKKRIILMFTIKSFWENNHGIGTTFKVQSILRIHIKFIAAVDIFIFSLENDSVPFVLRLYSLHSDVK